MIRTTLRIITLTATLFVFSCSGVKETLGLNRTAPDEFKVISNPPLSVPPEFRIQKPMDAKQSRIFRNSKANGRDIIFKSPPNSQGNKLTTTGDQSFKQKFGAANSNPNIKDVIAQENMKKIEKVKEEGFFEKLTDFSEGKREEKTDPIVDAMSERKRINDSKKEGEKIDGSKVETLDQSDDKSFFDRIFGN